VINLCSNIFSVYQKLAVISHMIHISLAVQHLLVIAQSTTNATPKPAINHTVQRDEARTPSRQPNIPKQKNQAEKEPNPNLPTHARFLRHAQHPVHRAS
jgi:hypothetical protein